ncbi:MAG: hypothetical protein JW797_02440 [Bradymonadales bacterium]|nr:hypothetical protein [Bradymonadales bacterium]
MKLIPRLSTCITGVLLALILPFSGALAQEDLQYVPVEVELEVQPDAGWTYALRLGLSTAFATANNVIGNPDGATWTLGFGVNGNLGLERNFHEWRNTLSIGETFSRTPVIDEFVKSADSLEFESIYLYHIPPAPWFGPFARLRLSTAIFAGQDVRPSDVTYLVAHLTGDPVPITAERLDLTDPFMPLTLKQAVGVFARPLAKPAINLEFLLGFGVRETLAEEQLTVTDNDETTEIEVTELDTFVQAGAEATMGLWGEVIGGRMAYNAGAEFMVPFINSAELDQDKSAFDLTNIDLTAGFSFRIVEWASLDYQFRALREPQLLDKFQIQNNLLLSIGYTLFERQAPAAE